MDRGHRAAFDSQRINALSHKIIGAAIEAHRVLGGPGLIEKVYEQAFAVELSLCGLRAQRQVFVPIEYKGHSLDAPLVLDLLVDDLVIIECKATEKYNPIYETQLLTYLRVTEKPFGLVINFGEKLVRDGIHRVVNGL